MRILVTNDDGYDSPGIAALAAAAAEFGQVTVVAPARNYSGASSALTLEKEIGVRRRDAHFFVVDGTPADCAHLVLSGSDDGRRLLEAMPDIIVSGINAGANMGDDTIYSGTVAAAMEGYLFGVPAVAFSMAQRDATHYATGAVVVRQILRRFAARPFDEPTLLNVNIPDVPAAELRGIRPTRLGRRHTAEPCVWLRAAGETAYYRIGEAGDAKDSAENTDFHCVADGFASVTPLTVDLTKHRQTDKIAQWLHG